MSKIYTKTGDKGQTSLYDGRRVSKASPIINVLGMIDQLNAYLGVLSLCIGKDPGAEVIQKRQDELMRLAAMLATYNGKFNPKAKFEISDKEVLALEKEMDIWQQMLPPLSHFILPGGSEAGAKAHFARTLCRNAERGLVKLSDQELLPPVILRYMNRLGDWLFLLARYLNKGKDIIWQVK